MLVESSAVVLVLLPQVPVLQQLVLQAVLPICSRVTPTCEMQLLMAVREWVLAERLVLSVVHSVESPQETVLNLRATLFRPLHQDPLLYPVQ